MIVKINEKQPNERTIGEIFPELHIFRKRVLLSRHLFKKLDAFGIDADYFTNVLFPNSYDIEIYEVEEGKIYKVSAEFFKKHAQYYHFKDIAEDHHAQIFLSRRFWRVYDLPKIK